mgnify:FL=1
MDLSYIRRKGYDKELKRADGSVIEYYSKARMKKKFPRGGYILAGGIGSGMGRPIGRLHTEEDSVPYYTLQYSRFTHGIDGYIDCGDKQFLAVVKNRLPRNLALLLLAAALAAGLGVLIWYLAGRGDGQGLDPNAEDYEPSFEYQGSTDPDHIALPGYEEINMAAETDTAYVALWNPPTNPCYFQFQVTYEGETLYESGLIEPGKAVTEVPLGRTFEAGTYDLKIVIKTFSLEDAKTPMNGGNIECTLNVYEE